MSKASTPDLDALTASLKALAQQLKASHQAYAKHLPTTDPNQYFHTLDCNLHTTVGGRFVRDEIQILELKDGTRVQYLSSKPELWFFVDIPKKKGKLSYLYLDCALQQKEASTYRNLAEVVSALDQKRAGNEARKDQGPSKDQGGAQLSSTLPPEPPLSVEESQKIKSGIAAAIKSARGKIDVPAGPRSKLGGELDALQMQKALRLELGSDKELDAVRLLRTTVPPRERDDFVAPMATSWIRAETKGATNRWLLLAAGELGGDETAAILGRCCWELRNDSKAHATLTAALDALGRMGALTAAHEIYALATMPSRYTKRRNEARTVLLRVAGRAGISIEALIAQAVPRDPSAQDRDRVIEVQSRRLERMMVDGKRLPLHRLRAELLEHPVLLPLCQRLVFGVFAATNQLEQSFRPDGKKLVDARGAELSLDPATQVGVAHAVELELAHVLTDWRAALSADSQPFAQLARPVRKLSERQASSNAIHDFKSYRREWLHEQEWWGYKVDSDYMSDVDTFAVMMERDGKSIEAKLDGQGRIFAIGMGKVDLDYDLKRKDYIATPSDSTRFGQLHPVSQSELLYAMLGNSAPPAARPAAPAPPSAGRYPYAEKAKSSRSQCLVCEKKIEKGTVRVVVEREIKSDAFSGVGAGYLHPDCARSYPDLASLPDLDAVIRKNSEIPFP